MSLRWRLALALGASAALAATVVAWAAWASTATRLRSDLDRAAAAQAEVVAAALDQRGGRPAGRGQGGRGGLQLVPPYRAGRLPDRIGPSQLLDASGAPVDTSGGVEIPVDAGDRAIAASTGRRATRVRTTTYDGTTVRVATAPLRAGGAVQAVVSRVGTEEALDALALRYGAIGLLVTLAAAGAGWVVATRLSRPLEQLATATESVAATGDLRVDLPAPGGQATEVGRLSRSFRQMLAALSASRAEQRRLVQDAGHELRTPLTSVRTNLEVLARHADLDPATRAEVLASMGTEVGELSRLVEEVVRLAAGDLTERPDPEPVDLADVVAAQVERTARRTGREIALTATATPLVGVVTELERAVANLLDNADKFSPPGAPIEVSLLGRRLAVADHGPGIAPQERPLVFERFHRADEARSVPGSGLGLSIVAQVAASHGGAVFAGDRPDGERGAEVGFALP